MDETDRRRAKQVTYNEANGITPATIIKAIDASLVEMYSPEWAVVPEIDEPKKSEKDELIPAHELPDRISALRREMMEAAEKLDYERAASLRDQIKRLERHMFGMDSQRPAAPTLPPGAAHRNVTDEVHGRLDRRKTASATIKETAGIGNKESAGVVNKELVGVGSKESAGVGNQTSQIPARGRPASVASSSTAKPKTGVRQGKLKLVPDDQK
jgi:hypothetical protein